MTVPRSNDTIKYRILHMSDDIVKAITNKHSKLHSGLQIDESLLISSVYGIVHILKFVRSSDKNKMVNQFVCFRELLDAQQDTMFLT